MKALAGGWRAFALGCAVGVLYRYVLSVILGSGVALFIVGMAMCPAGLLGLGISGNWSQLADASVVLLNGVLYWAAWQVMRWLGGRGALVRLVGAVFGVGLYVSYAIWIVRIAR